MDLQQKDILLAKHLSGQSTPEEKKLIEAWLNHNVENVNEFKKIEELWKNLSYSDEKQWDSITAWNEVKSKINRPTYFEIISSKTLQLFKSKSILKYAALLFIMITCSLLIKQTTAFFYDNDSYSEYIEVSTMQNEIKEVVLEDSSKVTINENSKIKFPKNGFMLNRRVVLEGEAFFSVKSDNKSTFKVYAKEFCTTVLGTKFNINSYKSNKVVAISLLEGKINISKRLNNVEKQLVSLKPKEQFIFNNMSNESLIDNYNPKEVMGWKFGYLKFINTPLEEVILNLSYHFGIDLFLADTTKNKLKITGNFQDESFRSIVKTIARVASCDVQEIKNSNGISKIIIK